MYVQIALPRLEPAIRWVFTAVASAGVNDLSIAAVTVIPRPVHTPACLPARLSAYLSTCVCVRIYTRVSDGVVLPSLQYPLPNAETFSG